MKITEALGILKKNGAIISEANKVDAGYDQRGWARYGFNSPNKNRGYVKMLNFLYHAENGMTKKMIHNWLGLSTAPGNHSGTWAEMADAGLAKYDEHERVWKITAKGIKYLEDNDLIVPLEDLTDGAGQIDAYDEPAKDKPKFSDPDDDDMYDDTPIVRQRDESFIGFLKQHGYCLTEAYDAVTDRNNIKNKRQISQSYLTHVMKRLKNALEEKGIDCTVKDYDGTVKGYTVLKIGKYKVTLLNFTEEYANVKEFGRNYEGAESGEDASYSQMDSNVILRFWDTTHLSPDEKVFDVRNTPGMVKWILDNLEECN